MTPELIMMLITQGIPLILKEYANLSQTTAFTADQRAALDAQIAGFSDYVTNPQWKPDTE